MNANREEMDARELLEQLVRLPEETRVRIGYIIQGAALVAGNHTQKGPERTDPAA